VDRDAQNWLSDVHREEQQWVVVSPADADGARPRFSPDGSSIFYQLTRGNVVTLAWRRFAPRE